MRALRIYLVCLLSLAPGFLGATCANSQRDDNCDDNDCVCSGGGCQCRPEIQSCNLECEKDCGLSCTDNHDCRFLCGEGCSVDCNSSGTCHAEVGRNSSVSCSGARGCNVVCRESCAVACKSNEPCSVQCKLHSAQTCPGNVIACGACP